MAEIKFSDMMAHLEDMQEQVRKGNAAIIALDALREDIADLRDHLQAYCHSYRSEALRTKHGEDHKRWCQGKAQAFELAASKLHELISDGTE
ncbi:hypothetical protein KIW74_gp03 [Mycobacterium phage Kimona]|uniref:Uncharacterized protein n=1 Tax=Mycobacterium phage Kimona TaxID=2024295 RepID=A0A249XU59_9CAUD|nr:hypothetical protein KIW74_gp03 [Mycobacterium phage Kimona]ASZ75525.1 hypothetical protein PBI_KIMONA_89 [Mycobacterium phage Kimona]